MLLSLVAVRLDLVSVASMRVWRVAPRVATRQHLREGLEQPTRPVHAEARSTCSWAKTASTEASTELQRAAMVQDLLFSSAFSFDTRFAQTVET